MTKSEEKRDVADIKCLRMGRDRHGIAKMRNERWPNTAPNGVKKKATLMISPIVFSPSCLDRFCVFMHGSVCFFPKNGGI